MQTYIQRRRSVHTPGNWLERRQREKTATGGGTEREDRQMEFSLYQARCPTTLRPVPRVHLPRFRGHCCLVDRFSTTMYNPIQPGSTLLEKKSRRTNENPKINSHYGLPFGALISLACSSQRYRQRCRASQCSPPSGSFPHTTRSQFYLTFSIGSNLVSYCDHSISICTV